MMISLLVRSVLPLAWLLTATVAADAVDLDSFARPVPAASATVFIVEQGGAGGFVAVGDEDSPSLPPAGFAAAASFTPRSRLCVWLLPHEVSPSGPLYILHCVFRV